MPKKGLGLSVLTSFVCKLCCKPQRQQEQLNLPDCVCFRLRYALTTNLVLCVAEVVIMLLTIYRSRTVGSNAQLSELRCTYRVAFQGPVHILEILVAKMKCLINIHIIQSNQCHLRPRQSRWK